ncbi:hypothetical protein RA276_29420, partial [Pseudomonas syringae pv. tagetis]|uniref:hypothetical protein n=1 Tax=Pseudomonas syringae group genomosp. 7 TaxID=251699 RepID=UPI0037702EBF
VAMDVQGLGDEKIGNLPGFNGVSQYKDVDALDRSVEPSAQILPIPARVILADEYLENVLGIHEAQLVRIPHPQRIAVLSRQRGFDE